MQNAKNADKEAPQRRGQLPGAHDVHEQRVARAIRHRQRRQSSRTCSNTRYVMYCSLVGSDKGYVISMLSGALNFVTSWFLDVTNRVLQYLISTYDMGIHCIYDTRVCKSASTALLTRHVR